MTQVVPTFSNFTRQITHVEELIWIAERQIELRNAELESLKKERSRLVTLQLEQDDE